MHNNLVQWNQLRSANFMVSLRSTLDEQEITIRRNYYRIDSDIALWLRVTTQFNVGEDR